MIVGGTSKWRVAEYAWREFLKQITEAGKVIISERWTPVKPKNLMHLLQELAKKKTEAKSKNLKPYHRWLLHPTLDHWDPPWNWSKQYNLTELDWAGPAMVAVSQPIWLFHKKCIKCTYMLSRIFRDWSIAWCMMDDAKCQNELYSCLITRLQTTSMYCHLCPLSTEWSVTDSSITASLDAEAL